MWRRDKVLQYLSQGRSQTEIAKELQVSNATISEDVALLRRWAKEKMHHHIEDRLPLEFEKSLASLEQLKHKAWSILEKEGVDERTILQAIEVVMACGAQTMDLLTHVGVIEHSLNYVENGNKKLDSMSTTEKEENPKADKEVQGNEVLVDDVQGSSTHNSTEGTTATSVTDRQA
jgi:hypothetical protein